MASIFDSYVTTATQDYIMPKVIDSVLDDNVLTSKLLGNSKKFRGEQIKQTWRVGSGTASSAQGGSFRGTDTFVTSIDNEVVQGAFNPKYVYEPLNLVYTDLSLNTGAEEVVDIVARETEFSFSNLLDNVGTMFYGSATDSSKDFSGLAHIVGATSSYGGVSRTTNTVLQSGDTSNSGFDSSTTTLTLAAMRTISNALSSGAIKPDLIVTTPAIFGFFEALLQPMQRMDIGGFHQVTRDGLAQNKGALGGAVGFDALMYDGIPVVRDEKCPADKMYFLNMKFLNFYRVESFGQMKGVDNGWKDVSFRPDVVQGQYAQNVESGHKTGFAWSGFKEPTNQAAVQSQIVLSGELINTDPRRSGGFSAITA
jgi:hypothetical protein